MAHVHAELLVPHGVQVVVDDVRRRYLGGEEREVIKEEKEINHEKKETEATSWQTSMRNSSPHKCLRSSFITAVVASLKKRKIN